MRGDAILAQLQGIAGGGDRVMQVGQWDKTTTERPFSRSIRINFYPGRDLLRRLYPLGKGVSPSMSGNMFRRDMALALGGFDDLFRGLFEDQVFRTKVYLRAPSSSPTKSSIATVSMTNPASASQRRPVSPMALGANSFCGWGSISTRSTVVTPSCA